MKSYALITGASAGIGKAYAYALAERGYNLILVARRKNLLTKISRDIGKLYKKEISVVSYEVDLTKKTARKKFIETITKNANKKHPISVLVNNAGFGDCAEFGKSNLNKQLMMIELNITALVELTHCVMPLISRYIQGMRITEKNTTGYILNIASVAGFQPGPYMANYYATKAYVLSFTEAVSEECVRSNNGVQVSVVCPGPTQSEFGEVAGFAQTGNKISKVFAKHRNKIPTAQSLAEYSLTQAFKNKRVIIHGAQFRFLQFMSRFLSRNTITRMIGNFQASRIDK